MTTPITKEQAKRLRNDFECWQQDYDPVADKEQYDMFGLGMVAMDALLAAMDAEPVADVVAWHKEGEERTCDIRWRRFDVAPGPLFAVAQPVEVLPDALDLQTCHLDGVTETYAEGWNACRAAMLNHSENERDMVELVSQPYKLPERVTNALTLSLQAMEFMGDTLNNLDAVCKEDVEFVAPAFEAVRAALAGNSPVIPDCSDNILRRWLAFGRAMQSYGSQLPRHLIAETESMLAAAPQQEAVSSALEHGMARYSGAMQKLADGGD